MNKKILIMVLPIILSGCQAFSSGENKKLKEENQIVKNIDFQMENLGDNYYDYVNTIQLVNMPPISRDLTTYLLEQIGSNATQIREAVETKEKFDDKMKDKTCGDLPKKLCEYNAHLYSGSYFGLKLYEKANNQELLNNSIVAAPLSMWSITWLRQSYEKGLKIAEVCKDADNLCLNKNASNPIEKLVALCKAGASNELNQCIGLVLDKPENKNFAFAIGYVTGYNISFNIGNGVK